MKKKTDEELRVEIIAEYAREADADAKAADKALAETGARISLETLKAKLS